jgi:FkbM family methyltransferase
VDDLIRGCNNGRRESSAAFTLAPADALEVLSLSACEIWSTCVRDKIKQWVKSGLSKAGYELIPHVQMPQRPFPVLPYVVTEQLQKDGNFFFLQIGASDGVVFDPLRELVLEHGLAGLLVEPLPDVFERLRTNYANHPRVEFECCAIGENDGEASIYRVRADAPFPSWVQLIASFNREHVSEARFGIPDLDRYVEEVKVPCLTIPSLLRKRGIQELTLLQIDTEGFDCEIVRMALEAGLRPPIINYEFLHSAPRDRANCKKRLVDAGYSFIDIGGDTLAIRRHSEDS